MRKAFLIFLLLPLTACEFGGDGTGVVYPGAGYHRYAVDLGTFGSLESCRKAAIDWLQTMPRPEIGTYRCGYKCNGIIKGQLQNCEESSI